MRASELRLVLIGGCLTLLAGTAAAAPPTYIHDCFACHGDKGVSQKSDVPTIAGMSEFYLEGQMDAYRKGQRPCEKVEDPATHKKTDMCDIAKALTPAQVKDVSTYFSKQKFVAAKQPVDAALAAKGKHIHDAHCEICHSDGGSEAMDDAGILAGQWKPYLIATMTEYHDGKRIEPEKMKPQTNKLSADDVKALAEFYASEGK